MRQSSKRVPDSAEKTVRDIPQRTGFGLCIHLTQRLISPRPDTERDYRSDHAVHEGRRQTVVGQRIPGAGSSLPAVLGKTRRTE